MITGKNRDITDIQYNYLNLPTQVTINGQNIMYTYDAVGTKLKKTVSGTTTDYAGNFIYENNVLQFFNTAEGYVEPNGSGWDYVYQYKDHLGNVRLSYSDLDNNGSITPSTEILKERNYYPFGLEHRGYNNVVIGTENNHKTFQGQELNKELGLNWLSFKYRNYDPAIGRFMTIDSLTNIYTDWGPYVFSGNRLIDARELEGLEPATVHRTMDDAAKNFGIFYNEISIKNNREYGSTIYEVVTSSGIQYAYSVPAIGETTELKDGVSPAPAGRKAVADIHSHAAYYPPYHEGNDIFSGIPPRGSNRLSINGDIGGNNIQRLIGYVTTPNSSLQKYDPFSGLITTLKITLFFDVKDPTSPPPRPIIPGSLTPIPIDPPKSIPYTPLFKT